MDNILLLAYLCLISFIYYYKRVPLSGIIALIYKGAKIIAYIYISIYKWR